MKNNKMWLLSILMIVLLCLTLSCATGPGAAPICFNVNGYWVTVMNFWSDGGSEGFDLSGGYTWRTDEITMGNETHTLKWTDIERDMYGYVISFNVKIDGKDYSYPWDKCNGHNEIVFKLNGTLYRYKESCGSRPYPFGYYIEGNDSVPEQYIIFGSKTTTDCEENKKVIIIGFVNDNVWNLNILYYDENGNSILFSSYDIDISLLENRDSIGEQMSASIPGPFISGENTLSDLSFLVERIY